MLLNSYCFIFFFIILFFIYWKLAKNATLQNAVLLLGGIIFYFSWSPQFLVLLLVTIAATFFISKKLIAANDSSRKWWSRLGILVVLLQLLYFKYFNFFIENVHDFLQQFGFETQKNILAIILPIGISFYSFRMIGYLLDVRNKKIKEIPTLLEYSVFVSFFPTMISGPIDRALPFVKQIKMKRDFSSESFSDGLRQILWGLFKKLVVADSIATITNPMFETYSTLNGSALLIGSMLYFVQLYADFSGYSDMAIGFSKMLGINVQLNFKFPLFAQNVADFWRKWHISLTSWLTDFVFTPLSIQFRDFGKWGLILAIIINFLLIGFWHGAEWHYVVFGLVNGLMYVPLILRGKLGKKVKTAVGLVPTFLEAKNIAITFLSFSLIMILFAVKDLTMAGEFYQRIFSLSLFEIPNFPFQKEVAVLIFLMIALEWITRHQEFALEFFLKRKPRLVRWGFYYALVFLIFLFYIAPKGYIYAQF
ncbi:D-alanyl-lipoteichoic acid acyltransferase DltB, MBOAT superfamily [Kaistella antarctica]|uniref:D-alanyl-lipoteichoic acid biosynthesis protein DltB n=1 Tax=Kaistella antarctica TaxID=266748 RepID=A0A448NSH3_9FLAO|nr:hypothetical protein HY04_04400 [Kaistella antarctica]SEV79938.1 D-alanyl-lipoteichoic acid acyltransferase DltB, MBOAT superfamily [Kaistella antarctica]VEH99976.1 D-alanyl-lipoteichoic acid biosynthesis protein DltB [Kaistella antarctica]